MYGGEDHAKIGQPVRIALKPVHKCLGECIRPRGCGFGRLGKLMCLVLL